MGNIVSKFVDMDGGISRKSFILRYIVLVIYVYILNVVKEVYIEAVIDLSKNGEEINMTIVNILSLILVLLALLAFISAVSLIIRRLIDLGKPKSIIFLSFIPLVNIFFILYLIFAKSKNTASRGEIKDNSFNEENEVINSIKTTSDEIQDHNFMKMELNPHDTDLESKTIINGKHLPSKDVKKVRLNLGKITVAAFVVLVIITIYLNYFYYPHNGVWEGNLYYRQITVKVDQGEGTIKIGPSESYKILIFDPHKRNSYVGINGRENRISVNGDVIVISLSDVHTNELGTLDEVLYLKKKK